MGEGRRDNKKGQSRGNFDRGDSFKGNSNREWTPSVPREMHKATCSECKSECDVPFKPTEGKPVYCRECFRKRRDGY